MNAMNNASANSALLDPIETASLDDLRRHCSSSACTGRCSTPTTTCRTTAQKFDARGVHPERSEVAGRPRQFPSPARPTCATTTPSACSPCRGARSRASTPLSGTTGKPTVVGYTAQRHRHLGRPGGPLDPRRRRPAGRHGAHRLRLRPVHRRPRRPLRRRAPGLHGGPDVRRPDREAGPADPGLPARHHHGHPVLHARHRRRDASARASTRASCSLRVGIFGAEPWTEPAARARSRAASASRPSTSTACPR